MKKRENWLIRFIRVLIKLSFVRQKKMEKSHMII